MNKRLIFFLFYLIAVLNISAKQYFIAINGNDSNEGSIASPFATFDKAYASVVPGDTIYVRSGTYAVSKRWEMNKAGNLANYYKLWAYPENPEQENGVILNVSADNGMRIASEGKYWYIRGFTIQNANDNGIRIFGSHNIIENCVFRGNSDSGLSIQQSNGTAANDGSIAGYNLVLNCDSYDNIEQSDDADGFACKLSPGAGNIFRGCRAWANADDGWDFYYSRFQTIVEDCWTFSNGINGGNGNGFKSNGSASSTSTPRTQASHVYIRSIAFDHKYKAGSNNKGFDQNHNEGNVTIINCLSFDNEKNFAYQEDTQNGKNHVFRNCVGFEPYSEKLARTLLPGEVVNAGTKDEISYRASNTWFASTIDDQYNSWNLFPETTEEVASRDDYVTLDKTAAMAPRQAGGSLPDNGFGRLKSDSKLIDKGIPYTFNLDLDRDAYPGNLYNPPYIVSTHITSLDGMPDLGPFEFVKELNPNNIAPVVSLTAPADNSEFDQGTPIVLSAAAVDTDGSIARVEFYAGAHLLGIAAAAPYSYTWTNPAEGTHILSAIAYDNEGGTGLSATVTIRVKNSGNQGGATTGETKPLLKLTSYSSTLTDEIVSQAWGKVNTVGSGSNGRIKLNFSSSKGGTLISPAIDLSKYVVQDLNLHFCSSGGGNRNLNIYLSFDGGATYTSAYTQSGGSNGTVISVAFPLADKTPTSGTSFVLKLEAANTIEVWDIEVLGAEKILTATDSIPVNRFSISCVPSVTEGFSSIVFDLEETAPVQIALYNTNGRKVKDVAYNNWFPAGQNSVLCDVSKLNKGLYICILSCGEYSRYTKIIKK
ncbi:MAG: right-handed parallel beta-helix repeat-containing protein [Dysgonamonadaceae bacterium]|jgi:hypothetical protein|nr:right-handed parallel beta-helix repeat-containing protein [Dysgonamonadaceae bacterium]